MDLKNVIENLDKNSILKRVDELTLFQYYIPSFRQVGKKFTSELREDRYPSCNVYRKNGRLFYKDFGNGESHDIFSYVMAKHGLTFLETLRVIANDFNLLKSNKLPTMKYFGVTGGVEVIEEQVKREIKVKYRKWNLVDKAYWFDRYCIPSKILTEYNVYPLEGHFYGSYWYPAKELTYGYYHHPDKWKIYRPLNDKKAKWPVGNFTKDIWCGFDNLPLSGNNLIITSSRKDTMCWKVLGYDAINPQSEHSEFDVMFVEKLKYRFNNVYINFDNDEQGIKATDQLLKTYPEFIPVFTPEHKDISDYIWKEGLDKTKVLVKSLIK